jgi:hypothetical protein
MSNIQILEKICDETKQSSEVVRGIAGKVLRELNYITTIDEQEATTTLMQCYCAFGAEAVCHLGGIMSYCTKDYDKVNEILEHFFEYENEEFNAVKKEWMKLTEERKGI